MRVSIAAALALAATLAATEGGHANPTAPSVITVALPVDADVTLGESEIVVIGKTTTVTPVYCAPGTPQPQSVVIIDPAGGFRPQIADVFAFAVDPLPIAAEPLPNGTRYVITGGGALCTSELALYSAMLQ